MNFNAAAPVRLTSDTTGHLVLGVASQLGGVVPADFETYVEWLYRAESRGLLFLGPPPYPKVEPAPDSKVECIPTLGVGHDIEIDLLHGRTGQSSKLFAVYDPALASGIARRRRATVLAAPHLGDAVPPIVLVGGTRVGGNTSIQVIEHAGGAWIVQVGVFSPCGPDEDGQDRSCGATILEIDLDDRDVPMVPRFMDFG
jgi:hypothetical protein